MDATKVVVVKVQTAFVGGVERTAEGSINGVGPVAKRAFCYRRLLYTAEDTEKI